MNIEHPNSQIEIIELHHTHKGSMLPAGYIYDVDAST